MAGMTPGRVPRKGDSPQRFAARAASSMPGKVRRALDGQIVSAQRNGETLQVDTSGRLNVRVRKGGGLRQTRQGLIVDKAVGEMNRAPLKRISKPTSTAATDVYDTVVELLEQLKKTGNMR